MFPTAKFLWMIRDANTFVNSAYPRGWFANSEFGYNEPHPNEFFKKQVTPSLFDAYHRTNGYRCGSMTEDEWKRMTAFERNCWYWSYWNRMIETHLGQLSNDRWMMIRLSELKNKQEDILSFLNLSKYALQNQRTNKAKYEKLKDEDWNDEMKSIYTKWCMPGMKKWFS